ncbi:MAG: APC family permease [Myxococcota bacterium]
MKENYEAGSLSLISTVALGTGVMIGAGVFALTGQMAELTGALFPFAFVSGALVAAFQAYSYVKVASAYPSAGGIAMILKKAWGPGVITAAASLMMALSMVINESLVARTFATYALRPFDLQGHAIAVPVIAVAVVAMTLVLNLLGNDVIGRVATLSAAVKVFGILVFGIVGLWASGLSFPVAERGWTEGGSIGTFIGASALGILAYKGFTTITNSGGEVVDPEKNVGRAIILSLVVCVAVYLVVAFAVGSSLTLEEIVQARDYALAEAARPALGDAGVTATVVLALVATSSGILASMFAVSRMITMLTEMELIPHRHLGMPGTVLDHNTVYVAAIAATLAAFFDLSRIASMGVFLYLTMDILVHVGLLRSLREEVNANVAIVGAAVLLDAVVMAAFAWLRIQNDPLIVGISVAVAGALFVGSAVFLRSRAGGS